MKKELIEKAADVYSTTKKPSYTNGDFDRIAIAQAFEDGADWRINSVWHNASEMPKIGRKFLVALGCYNCELDYLCHPNFDWRYYADKKGIIRWAYVHDLFPEKKGGAQ